MNQQFGPLLYTISVWALPAIIAITFHEAAHGFVARLLVLVRRLGSRPKGAGYIAAAPARLRRIVSIGAPMSSSSEFSWTATSWQSHADLRLRLRSSVHA
jgi:hypothetical protein